MFNQCGATSQSVQCVRLQVREVTFAVLGGSSINEMFISHSVVLLHLVLYTTSRLELD